MWIKDLKPCYTVGVSVLTGVLIGSVINVGRGNFIFFCTYIFYNILIKYIEKKAENAEFCVVINYSYKIVSRKVI
jgi:hypothetical protein